MASVRFAAYTAPKLQLLLLDCFIIFLQMLLISIAYETSSSGEDSISAPGNIIPPYPSASLSPPTPSLASFIGDRASDTYVLDLRWKSLWAHLATVPPIPESIDNPPLPLPNTSSRPVPPRLRAIARARAEMTHFAGYNMPVQRQAGESLVGRLPGAIEAGGDDD
jgi:hypothetical protein